jgi:hypothetical protein
LFFAGYKIGQTDIDIDSTKNWQYQRIDERGIGTAEFESKGFFIGTAYTYPIGKGIDKSLFSVKVALAKLDADYHQHSSLIQDNLAVGDGPKTTFDNDWFLSGNTLGWTVGANWTARTPFFKRLYYRVSVDLSNYDFEVDSAKLGMTPVTQAEYDMKERMFLFQLQVFYPFQW